MSIGSRPNRTGALSTYVISITPFDAEDQLDERALRTHLARMAAAGVGVYVGGGGSGEGYTLTPTETQRVLEIAAEELRGTVPVRAMGVEPRQATDTIALARTAEKAGIEALQLYSLDTGHGRLPRPDELETYFTDILDAITIPAVLSTHQSVGYFVDLATIGRLLDRFPRLIGVNCTNPDLTYLSRLVDVVDGRADIHVGGPVQALSALALGAQGYLVSEANLAPRLCAAVTDCWARGDLDGTARAFRDVIRLFTVVQAHGGVSGLKAALEALGLPGGTPRKPRLAVPTEWSDAILAIVDELDLPAREGFV